MKTKSAPTPAIIPAAIPAVASPAPKSAAPAIATLGALAGLLKPAAKTSKAKVYPVIPDEDKDQPVAALADYLAKEIDEFKSLEASVDAHKYEITALARQQFYKANHNRAEPFSSVEAKGHTKVILISFQNRYPGSADPDEVAALIGAEDSARYFRQSYSLKIDGDKIPADKANAVIEAIAAVLAEHECSDALTAKAVICPNSEYHVARHKFKPEVNLALDKLVPPVAVVRIKS